MDGILVSASQMANQGEVAWLADTVISRASISYLISKPLLLLQSIRRKTIPERYRQDLLAQKVLSNLAVFHPRDGAWTSLIQKAAICLIVDANLPFTIFENPAFQYMISGAGTRPQTLPWAGTSMVTASEGIWKQQKMVVQQELLHVDSEIHLGFDLWTSPGRQAIMGVTAHFIIKDKGPQVRLIAMKKQIGAHDGVNLANTLEQVITDWGITKQVKTLISDNASSNDTCIASLIPRLDPTVKKKQDIHARRIRCFGHILNLVSKAFLFGKDSDSFERQPDA